MHGPVSSASLDYPQVPWEVQLVGVTGGWCSRVQKVFQEKDQQLLLLLGGASGEQRLERRVLRRTSWGPPKENFAVIMGSRIRHLFYSTYHTDIFPLNKPSKNKIVQIFTLRKTWCFQSTTCEEDEAEQKQGSSTQTGKTRRFTTHALALMASHGAVCSLLLSLAVSVLIVINRGELENTGATFMWCSAYLFSAVFSSPV